MEIPSSCFSGGKKAPSGWTETEIVAELAPDADYLGVYSVYENESMTYVKLALGDDDSVEFLD